MVCWARPNLQQPAAGLKFLHFIYSALKAFHPNNFPMATTEERLDAAVPECVPTLRPVNIGTLLCLSSLCLPTLSPTSSVMLTELSTQHLQ